MQDLNLAILITRLIDGTNSRSTQQLIDLYFIEDGKIMDDPWLVSIGYWWKSEYFEAINTLSSMISEAKIKLSQKIFSKKPVFSLYKENAVYKLDMLTTNSQSQLNGMIGNTNTLSKSSKQLFKYPIISGRNSFVIDFIKQLLNNPIIKKETNKFEFDNSSSDDENGSIFDMFSDSKSKNKNQIKSQDIKKIEVDQNMLLSIISDYYSDKGFVFLSLILAYENKDIKMSKAASESLTKNLLVDIVKGTKSDCEESFDKIIKSIEELVKRFDLDKDEYFIFVRNQYRYLENLKLEF